MSPATITAPPDQLITEALADLGGLVRRVQAGSLQQDEFYDLTRRMRRTLKAARAALADEPEIVLSEAGAALGRLLDAGVIQPGTEILAGVDRGRTLAHLTIIEGGRDPAPVPSLGGNTRNPGA